MVAIRDVDDPPRIESMSTWARGERAIRRGTVFEDRYELLAELGAGGFSTVYKARQLATDQRVAIKVLHTTEHPARERRIARFHREIRVCGQLHHPNVVRLIDSGATAELVYSVFELAPGHDLRRVLAREARLDPVEAKHLMLQVLDALACAHACGVVHRDLKPANLMVVPTGARRNALVLDFGSAAWVGDAGQASHALGTPAYAAPEQLRGQPPTPRSDLYAWGLVFLECLTGDRVVTGGSVHDVIRRQLDAAPIELPAALATHPLAHILRRAVAKDPHARDITAHALLPALDACDVRALRDCFPPTPRATGDALPTLTMPCEAEPREP